jgi:hypothetical protein
MNTDAREDVLRLLRQLNDRLWIPYQAALEFHRNRFNVIHDQEQILKKLREAISDSALKLRETVNNVRDHPIINRESLASVIETSFKHINSYLDTICEEPILSIRTAMDADPVLDAVTELFAGKVGIAYTRDQMSKVETEGRQRLKDERPPGYADAKKDGNRALGDYILWRQILDEAIKRKLPALLVTNDQKDDWYLRLHGITIGPQPELVAEMLGEAGVPFHTQTLARFISNASSSMRPVKQTTVAEVTRLDEANRVAQRTEIESSQRQLRLSSNMADTSTFRELEILHQRLLLQETDLRAMIAVADRTADSDDPRSYMRTLEANLAHTLERVTEVERELHARQQARS